MTLAEDRKVVLGDEALTPAQIIERCELVFTRPYYLLVNGEPIGRTEWGVYLVRPGDVCHFVELPRGGGGSNPMQILATLAVLVAAPILGPLSVPGALMGTAWAAPLATGLLAMGGMALVNRFLAQGPPEQGAIGMADQPYSISSAGNRARINSPFAEHFGRLRVWPDLAAYPYVMYDSLNQFSAEADQYLYFIGIVGIGSYDIEGLYIGDQDADALDDCDYAILAPGQTPSIVPRICYVNNNLAGEDLTYLASEMMDHIRSTVINPAGTSISWVQWDIEFPAGLFIGGECKPMDAEIYVDLRKIDDDGTALTGWARVNSHPDTGKAGDYIRAATRKSVRGSFHYPVPWGPGRYELRVYGSHPGKAFFDSVTSSRMGQIRGVGGLYSDWADWPDDCTMIEMRVRASSQISGAIADKINCIATRKLYPVGETGFGGTLTATRSIADAAAYVVTATNGGKQDVSFIDWASLYALRGTWEAAGWYFDHRFQTRSSVMEACATIARCGRAVPYIPGKFLLVMDDAAALSMKYTVDDYTAGTFRMTHNLRSADDPTGVEVHYLDADTWSDGIIECFDADGSDNNLAVIEMPGVTSKAQAYDLGMYRYLDDKLNRTDVEFQTGLKGHIPLPGARVAIDVPAADGFVSSGLIQQIDGTDVYLSEAIEWDGSDGTGVLYITGSAGGLAGPYAVTMQAADHVVTGSLPAGTKTVATDAGEAARYLFAFSADETISMRVTRIDPVGQNEVKLSGTVYGALPYADPGTPASADALLASVDIGYAGIGASGYEYTVGWTGTTTEVRIEIDEGSGYAIEQDHYTTADYYNFYISTVANTAISVRVTPYDGDGVLQSGDAIEDAYAVPAPVENLALSGTVSDGAYSLTWDAVAGTDYYVMAFEAGGEIIGWLAAYENTRAITAAETLGMAGDDDVVAEDWTVHVASVIDGDAGKRDSLAVNYTGWNPTGLTATAKSYSILLEILYTQTASFEALEIWMAESNDRSAAVKAGETGAAQYLVSGLDNDGTYYFWVRVRLAGGRYTSWYPSSDAAGVECEITFTPDDVGAITTAPFEDGVTFSWEKVTSSYLRGYQYRAGTAWVAGKYYALNDVVSADNPVARQYKVTTAGTSGAAEPSWPASGTVNDGTVVWTEDTDNWEWTEIDSTKVDITLTKRQKTIQSHGTALLSIWVRSVDAFDNVSEIEATASDYCLNQKVSVTVGNDLDYATFDDIDEALRALVAGTCKKVHLKNGTYTSTISGEIVLPADIEITGESKEGTIINTTQNPTNTYLYLKEEGSYRFSNLTMGFRCVIASNDDSSDGLADSIDFKASNVHFTVSITLETNSPDSTINIEGCTLKSGTAYCIGNESTDCYGNIYINNCKIASTGVINGIVLDHYGTLIVTDCIFEDVAVLLGTFTTPTSTLGSYLFRGCHFYQSYINIEAGSDINVFDNEFEVEGYMFSPIRISDDLGNDSRCKIRDNKIIWKGSPGTNYGICVSGGPGSFEVKGNEIIFSEADSDANMIGIYIDYVDAGIISGNKISFLDTDSSASPNFRGIYLTANSSNCTGVGNIISGADTDVYDVGMNNTINYIDGGEW